MVYVFIYRITRVNLLCNSVQPCHQHGCKCNVGIATRIRSPELDPFRTGDSSSIHRNSYDSTPVSLAPGNVGRRLETRNKPPVRIDGRRYCTEAPAVFQKTSHEVSCFLTQLCVFIVRVVKEVFILQQLRHPGWVTARPEAYVYVHARPIVHRERFGHHRCDSPMFYSDILCHILQCSNRISSVRKAVPPYVDLHLSSCSNLMMMGFYR